MKKSELKKVLKPLIKECIKEVMFEDGTLSSIIAEVMRGTGAAQPIVENKQPAELQPRLGNNNDTRKIIAEKRRELMSSIGKDAYNGINLFEGTTPTTGESSSQGQGALSGVSPNDAGVDISKLVNKTSAIWQKMNEK
jgi:hypothetical protein